MELIHPDGTRLGAAIETSKKKEQGWVVIAGGTGIPHRYYKRLATWLAEHHNVHVLSFDYRGIGTSKPNRSMKGYQATFPDWASDLQTAVHYAAERGPTVVVGHSFGGQAFGMTDAHSYTRGLYTFATGAGWHGYMKTLESLRVRLLWNGLGPVLVGWKGFLPSKLVGMGEDLPLGVYKDWRRWCLSPNYFFDDPDAHFKSNFPRVDVPVIAVNSTDDAWAPPASAKAFIDHYPNASYVTITPEQLGMKSIGHMNYVRPVCQKLWENLGKWIDARLATPVHIQSEPTAQTSSQQTHA